MSSEIAKKYTLKPSQAKILFNVINNKMVGMGYNNIRINRPDRQIEKTDRIPCVHCGNKVQSKNMNVHLKTAKYCLNLREKEKTNE